MRKLRIGMILILTLALIIVGAYLPRIAAAVEDWMNNEKSNFAPMQSVQLEFRDNEQQNAAYMLRKLALENNMNTIPITPKEATMTEEEVYEAAMEGMEAYSDLGIFRWFKDTYRNAEPYLAIDPDDADNFIIFWAVNIVKEDKPYYNLFLHLDDETGKILYIDYVNYDTENYMFMPEDQRRSMEGFTDTYFHQLGLSEAMADTDIMKVSVAELNLDSESTAVRYSFTETDYGRIDIEFHFYPNGFYIDFPN